MLIYSDSFSYFLLSLKFFKSLVDDEKVRLRLALAIPTGVSITVVNDAIEMLPLVACFFLIKQSKIYQNNQKKQYTC